MFPDVVDEEVACFFETLFEGEQLLHNEVLGWRLVAKVLA